MGAMDRTREAPEPQLGIRLVTGYHPDAVELGFDKKCPSSMLEANLRVAYLRSLSVFKTLNRPRIGSA